MGLSGVHENTFRELGLVVVGPQRTASSWLDRVLRTHPALDLPINVKETFFFDLRYGKGWDWYISHFGPLLDGSMRVEVGSTYFESAEARKRIWTTNPEARILIMVRNPITRSFSSFGHEYAKGCVSGDFFKAVARQPRIVESGRYGLLAPKWETVFGSEQIRYVVQEDVEADPQGQFDAICGFIDLASTQIPKKMEARYGQGTVPRFRRLAATVTCTAAVLRGIRLHQIVQVGKWMGLKRIYSGGDRQVLSMTRPIFDFLLCEHEADISFLENRLGRDFSYWREPATYGL